MTTRLNDYLDNLVSGDDSSTVLGTGDMDSIRRLAPRGLAFAPDELAYQAFLGATGGPEGVPEFCHLTVAGMPTDDEDGHYEPDAVAILDAGDDEDEFNCTINVMTDDGGPATYTRSWRPSPGETKAECWAWIRELLSHVPVNTTHSLLVGLYGFRWTEY